MNNINSVLWINKKNYSCKDDSKLDIETICIEIDEWMKFEFIDVNNLKKKNSYVLGKSAGQKKTKETIM